MQTGLTLHDIRSLRPTPVIPLPSTLVGVGVVQRLEGVQQFVLRISPADAVRLLQNVHPRQRKVNANRVKEFLRSMQSGDWHEPPFTFDSIAFDAEGRLCNGRHRLTALAQYDKPLSFFAMVGVKSPREMPLPEGDSNMPRSKAFVAGIEKNEWAVITYLARCIYGGKSVARVDVQSMYPLFTAALAAISRTTTHPPAAPIRAAFVFAWATADFVMRQHIAEQWRAYCRVDVISMCPSTARLYKKIRETRAVKSEGGGEQDFRFESAVYAIFNPNAMKIFRQSDAKLMVREWVEKARQEGA